MKTINICCALLFASTLSGCSMFTSDNTSSDAKTQNQSVQTNQNIVNPRAIYINCTLNNDPQACKEGLEIFPHVKMDNEYKRKVIYEIEDKACELDIYKACSGAGDRLIQGQFFYTHNSQSNKFGYRVEGRDIEKGLQLVVNACNHDDGRSCSTVADTLRGKEHGFTKDFTEDEKKTIGKIVGINYFNDTQRTNKIFELYQKACSLDNNECWNLGLMYQLGIRPVKKDLDKALLYYKYTEAKERQEGKTISMVLELIGEVYEQNHDYNNALAYYERDCSSAIKRGSSPDFNSSCKNYNRLKNKLK